MWGEELRLVEMAAEYGFDSVWSAFEHHFNDYSFVPDNLQLMTHIAAKHPNIDVGRQPSSYPGTNPAAGGRKRRRSRYAQRRTAPAGVRARTGPAGV